jgi:hypothetical protein
LIARGIDYVGGIFGVNLPPDVVDFIANAIQGFLHYLIDWIKKLFGDDVLGSHTGTATIHSYIPELERYWNEAIPILGLGVCRCRWMLAHQMHWRLES